MLVAVNGFRAVSSLTWGSKCTTSRIDRAVGLSQTKSHERVTNKRHESSSALWKLGTCGKDARWAIRAPEESLILHRLLLYANIADCHANVAYWTGLRRGHVSGLREVISRLYLACRRTRLWPMPLCGLLPHCGHVDHGLCMYHEYSLAGIGRCGLVVFVHLYTSLSRIAELNH